MAIGARPNYVEAYNNLALILWDRKRHDEALGVIAKAMAVQPARASSLMIAGRFYNEREEFGRAVECYRKALSLRPRSLEILNTLSAIFLDIGDLAGADEMLQRMVALNPGHAATRVRRSMLRMLRGDMDGGLAEYDWRLAMPNVRPKDLPPLRPVNLPGRLWNGEPIEGKRLFIWSEQGLGDAIHCMRYLPNLAARGPAVLSGYFPPKLHQLSALNFPFFRIVPTGAEPPEADFHCEMMTLLRLVGRSPEWVETGKPYFKAPPGLVQEFRQRFSAYPGLKVGLVWAGNVNACQRVEAACRHCGLPFFQSPGGRQGGRCRPHQFRRYRHFQGCLEHHFDGGGHCGARPRDRSRYLACASRGRHRDAGLDAALACAGLALGPYRRYDAALQVDAAGPSAPAAELADGHCRRLGCTSAGRRAKNRATER
jgi:hypothetical protein